MKLTKKDAQLISEEYGLGKFISIVPFKGGLNNFNHKLKTKGGSYVVRIIGNGLTTRGSLHAFEGPCDS